jgi:alkylation response protein AidB-like acyl-CoA dehydrogenase
MNFSLTEDQTSLMTGLDQLLASEAPPAPTEPVFTEYAHGLDAALVESGFLDIAREEGFGLLDAALIVERLARLPQTVEAASTAMIGPALGLEPGVRPIALTSGSATRAARYLPMAQVLIVDRGADALILPVDAAKVAPVETLFAYPYGRLIEVDENRGQVFADVALLRRIWRIALAAEAAGCMAAAVAAVVEHVTTRQAFGRPLGAFQAVQHRLAMAAETTESAKWLALRAAWSGREEDAAVAAGFVQARIPQFTFDLHQFSGAMGLTLEFPLHYWTYRLRALVGELGGSSGQARAAALAAWGDAA